MAAAKLQLLHLMPKLKFNPLMACQTFYYFFFYMLVAYNEKALDAVAQKYLEKTVWDCSTVSCFPIIECSMEKINDGRKKLQMVALLTSD